VALAFGASCGGREVAPRTEVARPAAPAASTSTAALPATEKSPPVEAPAPPNPLPSSVEPGPRKAISQAATQLSLGEDVRCILLAEGRAACWGRLVQASVARRIAVELEGMRDLSSIAVTEGGACGVTAQGKVTCVATHQRAEPSPLAGLTAIAEVRGACARSAGGDVTCVDGKSRLVMKQIKGAKALFPFDEGACALAGGAAVCLSRASAKEKDAASPRAKPVRIEDATEMAVVRGMFCARTRDGNVLCRDPWGYDAAFELEPLRGTTHLAMTHGTACGIDAKGGVVCAATGQSRDDGPKGAGTGALLVSGVTDTRTLALAKGSGCALAGDGHVACFPLRSAGAKLVAEGMVGVERASCRRVPEADVCWEKDDPRLPSAASTLEARRIEGVHDIVELASDGRSYCARRKDAQVLCFASPSRRGPQRERVQRASRALGRCQDLGRAVADRRARREDDRRRRASRLRASKGRPRRLLGRRSLRAARRRHA
jgi:hypothetical protein